MFKQILKILFKNKLNALKFCDQYVVRTLLNTFVKNYSDEKIIKKL